MVYKPKHPKLVTVYTDGSCNPVAGIGGWAAMLFVEDEKILLSGSQSGTTHQCMELTAAIKAIEHLQKLELQQADITIFTDSQYLVNLPQRRNKLIFSGMTTKSKPPIRNAALIRQIFEHLDAISIRFIKVKAHEKSGENANYNREVDKISRKIVRDFVRNANRKDT